MSIASIQSSIPLSLYIHTPWCVKKCPYCDFNSHQQPEKLPEREYVTALLEDLEQQLPLLGARALHSIFIGGGTPSLLSPAAYRELFAGIRTRVEVPADIEITLEANPGTVEQARFIGFREAGINRLSIGLQSLDNNQLKSLGRIHSAEEGVAAVSAAQGAGFDNINIDIMFGLPNQSIDQALEDLAQGLALGTTHFSWYQLTLEPNTVFYKFPPNLPDEESCWEMQMAGQELLAKHGFEQYEVSAYARANYRCAHNLNYWRFGDYVGIGAGAHGKLSLADGRILRRVNYKSPSYYLDGQRSYCQRESVVAVNERAFEFMLNALRLLEPVSKAVFYQRTGLSEADVMPMIAVAIDRELLLDRSDAWEVTPLGRRFLNDLIGVFII